MEQKLISWLPRAVALLAGVFALSGLALATTQYVITNDDLPYPFLNSISVYTVEAGGVLSAPQQIKTYGFGIAGGFFGTNRVSMLNSGSQQCVYSSAAATGEIVGVAIDTLTVGGSANGSPTDLGTTNGIGLAMNSQYLYASFTDTNTIGTFAVQSGCGLTFINDVSVAGLAGGVINGMAIYGNVLIATYTDGSIQSFNVSTGTPISNGDEQYSTATLNSMDATYPNSIDVTSDGHYAIFGDTSTSVVVEVSDISSGKLTPTVVYPGKGSISSSNIMLSPDETVLYVINTQGATVTAFFFNAVTGVLSGGCTSKTVSGQSANWSYLAGLALARQTGNGGGVYVAEYGSTSGIALVSLAVTGQTCAMQEVSGSPFNDPDSLGLLSIGIFPPRSF
ncbi:MAG: beta-propeller fold lactonase family protein [Terriglobales bacterium]|jgi:lactonase family protein with 7-bladed beta-propeller